MEKGAGFMKKALIIKQIYAIMIGIFVLFLMCWLEDVRANSNKAIFLMNNAKPLHFIAKISPEEQVSLDDIRKKKIYNLK